MTNDNDSRGGIMPPSKSSSPRPPSITPPLPGREEGPGGEDSPIDGCTCGPFPTITLPSVRSKQFPAEEWRDEEQEEQAQSDLLSACQTHGCFHLVLILAEEDRKKVDSDGTLSVGEEAGCRGGGESYLAKCRTRPPPCRNHHFHSRSSGCRKGTHPTDQRHEKGRGDSPDGSETDAAGFAPRTNGRTSPSWWSFCGGSVDGENDGRSSSAEDIIEPLFPPSAEGGEEILSTIPAFRANITNTYRRHSEYRGRTAESGQSGTTKTTTASAGKNWFVDSATGRSDEADAAARLASTTADSAMSTTLRGGAEQAEPKQSWEYRRCTSCCCRRCGSCCRGHHSGENLSRRGAAPPGMAGGHVHGLGGGGSKQRQEESAVLGEINSNDIVGGKEDESRNNRIDADEHDDMVDGTLHRWTNVLHSVACQLSELLDLPDGMVVKEPCHCCSCNCSENSHQCREWDRGGSARADIEASPRFGQDGDESKEQGVLAENDRDALIHEVGGGGMECTHHHYNPPKDYIAESTNCNIDLLRVFRYDPVEHPRASLPQPLSSSLQQTSPETGEQYDPSCREGQQKSVILGSSPHTDWGTMTIVWQDDVGGLQMYCHYHDRWNNVPARTTHDCDHSKLERGRSAGEAVRLFVHVGDFLSLATISPSSSSSTRKEWQEEQQPLWHSPRHRVVSPRKGVDKQRYSLVYFVYPSPGVTLGQAQMEMEERRRRHQQRRWESVQVNPYNSSSSSSSRNCKTCDESALEVFLSRYSVLHDQSADGPKRILGSDTNHDDDEEALAASTIVQRYKTQIRNAPFHHVIAKKWGEVQRGPT